MQRVQVAGVWGGGEAECGVQEGAGCRSVQAAEGYMVHGGGRAVQESVGCGRVQGAGWIEEDAGCMCT